MEDLLWVNSLVKGSRVAAWVSALPAPTGLLKFGIGFVSPYIRDAVAVRVEQSLPTLKMLGIVDEGKVDLDRASAAAYAALEEAGGKVELSGYMVDKADIDALLEIAKKHAVD